MPSSFARRLQLHLKVLGIHGVPISLDDYYKDTKDIELGDDGKPDFESPEAIDYSCFNDNVIEATAACQLPQPSGLKIGAITLPTAASILMSS